MIVTISEDEWQECLKIGKIMQEKGKRYKHRPGYKNWTGTQEIVGKAHGAAAERIISRFIDQPWNGYKTWKDQADVGDNNEVKNTLRPDGCLFIQPTDRILDIAWLVTGEHLDYVIRGYLGIMACRQDRYFNAEQKNWWVPQSALWPADSWHKVMA